ncbi:MAG TPA: hypothetical protein VK034_05305, partial [Enhygromyxa sp.]|nr:hypothetical protein [Enhygromyxa sp.]
FLLDRPNYQLQAPGLAVAPDGDALLAVQLAESGQAPVSELGAFVWDNANQSWSEPIKLSQSATTNVTKVAIEPVSGDMFVAWVEGSSVHVAHRDADTQIWDEQVFVPAFESMYPLHLRALDNGEVMLILRDATFDFSFVGHLVAWTHDGTGWGSEHILTEDPVDFRSVGLY